LVSRQTPLRRRDCPLRSLTGGRPRRSGHDERRV